MSIQRTKIPWATHVWNPVTGCTRISDGCDNCYAHAWAKRFNGGEFDVTVHYGRLNDRMPRNPARIFVGSMTDLFHPMMPPLARATIFARIAAYPQHTFMILTKRPTVMLEYIRTLKYQMTMCLNNAHWLQRRMPNLWLGVSVEDKESAIVRIETLINVPCRNKFVSAEPLLGPVYLQPEWLKNIGWVIAGPETGPGKRHCESEWIDDLMAQCGKNNIPFFDKRKGGWREWPMEMDM